MGLFNKQSKASKKELKKRNQRCIKQFKESVVQNSKVLRDETLRMLDQFIEQDAHYAPFHYTKGYILQSVKDFKQAGKCYSRAIDLDPEYQEAFSNRSICYKERAKLEKALADASNAVRFSEPRSLNRAVAYMNRAQLYDVLHKPDLAVQDYTRHIELRGPAAPEALNNRGLALAVLGKPEQAKEDFDKAISSSPKSAPFYFNRATLLEALNPVQFTDEIVSDYNDSVRLDSKNPLFAARRQAFLAKCTPKKANPTATTRATATSKPNPKPKPKVKPKKKAAAGAATASVSQSELGLETRDSEQISSEEEGGGAAGDDDDDDDDAREPLLEKKQPPPRPKRTPAVGKKKIVKKKKKTNPVPIN